MYINKILLSLGCIPWFGIEQSVKYARRLGYDGIELLPTRKVNHEINQAIKDYGENWKIVFSYIDHVAHVHHSWRLDTGWDEAYGIGHISSFLFRYIRTILFPTDAVTISCINRLVEALHIPVTVHDITPRWTKNQQSEFSGGIAYEIMNTDKTKKELKKWLHQKGHLIVIDSRDDQSLSWAKHNGFSDWKEFWTWIDLKNIVNYQLTLIGMNGVKRILHRKNTLAEKQLLWLHQKRWKGSVTVEINPLVLFLTSNCHFQKGFKAIADFINTTLIEGKRWSKEM